MIREVRKIGDPILRKKATKIDKVTKDILKLLDDMRETMLAQNGQGIAAPQIGVSQRIAIVEIPKKDEDPNSGVLYTLINPEIVKFSEEKWEHQEGCLSIPGWVGDVERPLKIVVKSLDRAGNRVKFEAEGMLARAIQHEIDHLDGVLYIDKLVAPDRVYRLKEEAEEK
jgi:peptide deformylase